MNIITRASKMTVAVLLLLILTVSAVSAQAMKGMSGMGTKSHGGPSASKPMAEQMAADFPPLWKEALGKLSLTSEHKQKAATLLKDARKTLTDNWNALQDALKREAAARGDAKKTAQRRVDLAHSERDLVISSVETELKGFLASEKVDVIMSAAFHGVSKAHTGDMPMGDTHGMSELQELSMKLMDMTGMMNADYKALTLDTVIRDLEAK